MKHALIGSLFYLAMLADFHSPTWGIGFIHPSFLDACFLIACQSYGATGAAFWGGLSGLLSDVVHGRPLGEGVLVHATLGLTIGWFMQNKRRQSLFYTLPVSLLALTAITFIRKRFQLLSHLQDPDAAKEFLSVLAGQIALTYLITTICLMVIDSFKKKESSRYS